MMSWFPAVCRACYVTSGYAEKRRARRKSLSISESQPFPMRATDLLNVIRGNTPNTPPDTLNTSEGKRLFPDNMAKYPRLTPNNRHV